MINKGFKRVTLGVEDNEYGENNLKIYKHYGFNEFVKTEIESEPLDSSEDEPIKYRVNYYAKDLNK